MSEETLSHYETFMDLAQSAYKGCQLCRLLYAGIGFFMYWYPVPYALCITYGYSHGQKVNSKPELTDRRFGNFWIRVKQETVDRGETRFCRFWLGRQSASDEDLGSFRTDSDEVFDCASTWLKTCLETHEMCRKGAQDTNFCPRRLLRISFVDSQLVLQLCKTDGVPSRLLYLTLSYCWGGGNDVQLTQATEQAFIEGIPAQHLPRTLLDAVVITARLGYKYLWIDALCIIQDSQEDKEYDLQTMGEIYKYSVCTIAALSASNSSEGCFFDRNPLALEEYRVRDNYHEGCRAAQPHFEAIPPELYFPPHPLHTRAWTIQERTLSPRILSYGSDMIFWDCVQCRAVEYEPQMRDIWGADSRQPLVSNFRRWEHTAPPLRTSYEKLLNAGNEDYSMWRDDWGHLLREYTSCRMSFDDDKWHALSGLATEISKKCGEELFHGLWKNQLHYELLWAAKEPGRRLTSMEAPSWSWLSIDAIIWRPEFENVEFTTTISFPLPEEESSAVGRTIIVEGPLLDLSEMIPAHSYEKSVGMEVVADREPNVSWVNLYLDTKERLMHNYALQLIRHTRKASDGDLHKNKHRIYGTTYEGLILTPVDDSHTTWSRVGHYIAFRNPNDFASSESPPDGFGVRTSIRLI